MNRKERKKLILQICRNARSKKYFFKPYEIRKDIRQRPLKTFSKFMLFYPIPTLIKESFDKVHIEPKTVTFKRFNIT